MFLQTLIHALFLSIKARDSQSQAWGCCITDRTISSIQVPFHRDLATVRMLSLIDFSFILEVLYLYDAISPEVPTPAEFSLPYTDLELTTSDGVKLKCYLLLQRPDLHVPGATKIEWDSDGEDDKYEMVHHTSKLDGSCSSSMSDPIVPISTHSLLQLVRPLSCFTGMAEIWVTESRLLRFFSRRCAAMFSCCRTAGK